MTKKATLRGLLLLAVGLLVAAPSWAATIQVTTHISGNATWFHTNTYVLNGFIYVLNNATLTIQPGTVVKAQPGVDANTSALIVTAGGKIFANGTRTQPIIFTALADDVLDPEDLPQFQRGLWGGVVLLGKAVLNTTVDSAGNTANPKYEVFEGLPDTVVSGQNVHRFGGNDDNDSSGVFRYVSIRHAGVVFQPNRELNGLSMGAVGRGTVLEYVETYCIADDGFEFFGGTVNSKYLVSAFNDDDSFDMDQGYRGKGQFWFSIQEPGRKDHGGEWNGEPNGLAVNNPPIANWEIYNMTMIGAGNTTTNNRGLFIREYAAPKVYNSIFNGFGGFGVRIDDRSGTHLASGLLDIRNTIWFNIASNLAETANAQVLFTDASRSNVNVNPGLRSVSRATSGALDPRLLPTSVALNGARTPPTDGFYTPVAYHGAFDTNDLWLSSWTALDHHGYIPMRSATIVNVTTHISGTANWTRNNEYRLQGFIYVLNGGVLNIEAGTVIKAQPGVDAATTALIVTRGGKIFANGTQNNPIIFTALSDDVFDPTDLPIFQRGLWGGVVLLGRSVLNTAVDSAGNTANPKYEVFEGLPDTVVSGQSVHRFGGNDDNDSSGVLRYVSIRHAGVVFQPNRELNGLSMGAVGRGTTLEFVEAFATADDGFEFFGGTVNSRYLISAYNDDDSFDIDQGFRGKNQFWFSIQEPGRKDHGGEWNGEPNGLAVSNTPIANYEVYNMTMIGAGMMTTNNRALFIREYAAPRMYNSIVTDFGGFGVRIDDRSGTHLASGLLDIRDNIWFNIASNLAETANAQVLFTDPARNNDNVNPQLLAVSRQPNYTLDPRLASGSPALTHGRATPSGYVPASYAGAFVNTNWAAHWTALGELGLISTAGATAPLPFTGGFTPECNPGLTLTVDRGTGDITISWSSETGKSYQLQSKTDLNAATWDNEGAPQAGTGGTLSVTVPSGSGLKFFRVQCL